MFRFATVFAASLLAIAVSAMQTSYAQVSDVISDFLYYTEELKIKAPARPVATLLGSLGQRYIGFIDTDGGVRAWDLETGGQIQVEGRRPTGAAALFTNARGGNLIVKDADGRVYETAGMSFKAKNGLLVAGAASDAVAVSPGGAAVVGAGAGAVHIYNMGNKETTDVALADKVRRMWVSDEGRFVAFEGPGGTGVVDVDRKVALPLAPGSGEVRFYYDAGGGARIAHRDAPRHLTLYRYDGQAFVKSGEHNFSETVDDFWIRNDREIYWTAKNAVFVSALGRSGGKSLFAPKEPVVQVRNVHSGDDLLVVLKSGAIAIYSPNAGKVVATGYGTENGWAVIDANKRYDGSASGAKEMSWVISKMDLDLDKFAKRFFEPGLLLHYVGQIQAGFASPGLTGQVPIPPTIADVKLLENVAGTGRSVVLVTARNLKEDISEIEVYHNGKRIAEQAKISDEASQREDIRLRAAGYEIRPAPGLNKISVVGVGRLGIEGPTRELSFDRPGAPSRTLHLLAIGVDQYRVPALKLSYARGDAEAFARLMRESKGLDRVAVSELYDSQVTRDSVIERLRAVAAAAGPGDTVAIFLSGHGLAIRGAWYFLSSAVPGLTEGEVVANSVSAEQIASTLKGSAASHIVLMVDACNSGAVVKDLRGLAQNRIYAEMGRDTGFVILAASRQDQSALERATLGHGVFTAAALAALSGEADRDHDGRVTARELVAYLSRQIPTLATEHLNEVQIPVAYAPSEDFVIRALR